MMGRIIQVLLLTVISTYVIADPEEACGVQVDINTQGRDHLGESTVSSWQKCACACAGNDACSTWTWHHMDSGEYSGICVLMSGYEYTKGDANSITGTRCDSALVCPEGACGVQEGLNTQGRDYLGESTVSSWQECACACAGNDACSTWTWHHMDSSKYSGSCVLMSGYANTNDDNNTITGTSCAAGVVCE